MLSRDFPAWRYGPGGVSQIFQSEDAVPAGWVDHPSKIDQAAGAETGTRTAVQSANGPKISESQAAGTTDAVSQTHVDPAVSAQSGVGGAGNVDPSLASQGGGALELDKPEIDAHGHPWSADLHAASKGKTKDGLWRMKIGRSRPGPAAGYPLDL